MTVNREDIPPCTCAEFRISMFMRHTAPYVDGVGCRRHPNSSIAGPDKAAARQVIRSESAVKGWQTRRARQFAHDEEPEVPIVWKRGRP